MCYFVSLGIDARGRQAVEALMQDRRGFHVAPVANPSVIALFPRTDAVLEITHGGCSCDLVGQDRPPAEVDEARLSHRYRNQGWPPAKIERAIRQAALHAARSAGRGTPGDNVEQQFRQQVANLIERTGSGRLFVHMYSGDQTAEQVSASGQATTSVDEFRGEAKLAEDVLISLVLSKRLT